MDFKENYVEYKSPNTHEVLEQTKVSYGHMVT